MNASCNHVWTTGNVVTGTRYCTKCSKEKASPIDIRQERLILAWEVITRPDGSQERRRMLLREVGHGRA